MKKAILALSLALLPLAGLCQDAVKTTAEGKVTISSNGNDVRTIFHSLFTQAGKSYVLEPFTYKQLHLNLENVAFDEALNIVCKLGILKFEVQNDIYFISRDKSGSSDSLFTSKAPAVVETKEPVVEAPKKGKLHHAVLNKKISTRLAKTDIREVFAEFAKQTELTIEVNANVPQYKLDAFLMNTSLKYSLDVITKAAGLQYRFTNNFSIEIYRPEKATKH